MSVPTLQWDAGLAVLACQLNNETLLSFTKERFDRAHDPLPASNRQPLPHPNRPLAREMPGRHDLIA